VLRYNKYAKAELVADAPSMAMIAALKAHKGRICPLECQRGFKLRGDACVPIKGPSRRDQGIGRRGEGRHSTAEPAPSRGPVPVAAETGPPNSARSYPLR
jgi:hypothetical protein